MWCEAALGTAISASAIPGGDRAVEAAKDQRPLRPE